MHFYITGDTHRSFDRIEDFCYGYETTTEDVMIILGDAGINYWLDLSDKELKGRLSEMDITFFCVHGNHEARPWEVSMSGSGPRRQGASSSDPVFDPPPQQRRKMTSDRSLRKFCLIYPSCSFYPP